MKKLLKSAVAAASLVLASQAHAVDPVTCVVTGIDLTCGLVKLIFKNGTTSTQLPSNVSISFEADADSFSLVMQGGFVESAFNVTFQADSPYWHANATLSADYSVWYAPGSDYVAASTTFWHEAPYPGGSDTHVSDGEIFKADFQTKANKPLTVPPGDVVSHEEHWDKYTTSGSVLWQDMNDISNWTFVVKGQHVSMVPEPETYLMIPACLLTLGAMRRFRRT